MYGFRLHKNMPWNSDFSHNHFRLTFHWNCLVIQGTNQDDEKIKISVHRASKSVVWLQWYLCAGGKRKKIRLLYSLIFGACFITFRLAVFLFSRLHHVQSFVPQHGFELRTWSCKIQSTWNEFWFPNFTTNVQRRLGMFVQYVESLILHL